MQIEQKYVELVDIPQQASVIPKEKFYDKFMEELEKPCHLFIDQSSASAYTIFDSKSRMVSYGIVFRNKDEQNMLKYANELQEELVKLCEEFDVHHIYHEEVYNEANMITTEQLFYLKNKIKEMAITYPELNLEVSGLDASAWKSALAKGSSYKMPTDREEQKKATQKMVEEIYPLLGMDEFKKYDDLFDASGMGISLMLKGDKKNPWKMTRYNKKLPVETFITEQDVTEDNIEEIVKKFRKPFRDAYATGGYFELELDRRKKIEDTVKKYLSHKDVLLVVRIPSDYKYWGYMLLMNNINPDNLTREDESFYYVTCRKKRL